MKLARDAFFSWLPLGVAITGLCLLVQLTVQQNYRQGLNDPQIQMAEDGAAALGGGKTLSAVVPSDQHVDIAASLSPWIAVYDSTGAPLMSSGYLNGKSARPPFSVLEAAKNGLPLVVGHHLTAGVPSNENRVSWQPESGVRQAVVVDYVPGTGQYVVAGRNMREVENREEQLSSIAALAWLAIIAATFLAELVRRSALR